MAKTPDKQTSPKVATQASKILQDPKPKKAEKSVAASDLAQSKTPDKQTSPKVATEASKILKDTKSNPSEKSVAASDLSQAGGKKKKK
jgi:hypothetical protein